LSNATFLKSEFNKYLGISGNSQKPGDMQICGEFEDRYFLIEKMINNRKKVLIKDSPWLIYKYNRIGREGGFGL